MNKNEELQHLRERLTNLERAFQLLHEDRWEKSDKKADSLMQQLYEIASRLEAWSERHEMQQAEALEVLSALTRELADSSVETTQVLPVTVFLDTHSRLVVEDTSRAIGDFLSTLDFDLFFEASGEWGSWFGRSFARSKRAMTSQVVKDTLTRGERALEMQALHLPQAQIDALQADATAKLISALATTNDALIQIGSVLLVKVDGTPIVRNLTQIELSYLEHNKHLYKSPKNALEELARISGDPNRFALPDPKQIHDIEYGSSAER